MYNIQIAITGIGIVSPIGIGITNFKKALLRDTTAQPRDHLIFRNFNAREYTQSDNIRRMTRGTQFGLIACEEALREAKITIPNANKRNDIFIVYATTHPVISYVEEFHKSLLEYGPSGATPMCFAAGIHNAAPFFIGKQFGITGGATTIIGLSGAGINAVIEGCEILANDKNKNVVLLVSSTEITQLFIKAYAGLYKNSREKMPLLTEGGACLVMERLPDATLRNAKIRALITNWDDMYKLPILPAIHYPFGEGFAYTTIANIVTAILSAKSDTNIDSRILITSNEAENQRKGIVLKVM